jgi:hypothetical protein
VFIKNFGPNLLRGRASMEAAPAFWRAALLDMAAAAHFLSKAGLLFEVRLGCAQLNGRAFLLAFGEDRVEQETESELSHWFDSGEDLE